MAESDKSYSGSSDVSKKSKEKGLDEVTEVSSDLGASTTINKKHSVTPLGKKSKSSKHKKQQDVHSLSPEVKLDIAEIKNNRSPPSPSDYEPGEEQPIVWDDSSARYSEGGDGKEWDFTLKDFMSNFEIITKAMKTNPSFSSMASSSSSSSPKSTERCEELELSYFVSKKKPPKPKVVKKLVNGTEVSAEHCAELLKQLDTLTNAELLAKENLKNKKNSSAISTETVDVKLNKEENNSFEDLWGDEDPDFLAEASQLSEKIENSLNSASADGSGIELNGVNISSNKRELSCQSNTFSTKLVPQLQYDRQPYVHKCHTKGNSSCFKCEVSHGNICDYKENCTSIVLHSQSLHCAPKIPDKDKKKKYTFTKKFHSDGYLYVRDGNSHGFSEAASSNFSKEKKSLNKTVLNLCSNSSNKEENADDFDSLLDSIDDDILSQPEVLSFLDKVEAEASSQRIYSQEEIEKKRAAAIKRRQEHHRMRNKK